MLLKIDFTPMNLIGKTEFFTSAFVHLFCQGVTPIDQKQHHPNKGNLYFHLTFHLGFVEKFYPHFSSRLNV